MIGHAILFIVLPLAVAWLAGASAYFPPYPAPKTEPEIEPQFEAEVRTFLALHSEPGAAADRRMVPGVRGNALMDEAASAARLAANDLPSGARSRADEGDLAA
jgi:UDP:flavonoid glycosyltransferase YjiC (YdhE family)